MPPTAPTDSPFTVVSDDAALTNDTAIVGGGNVRVEMGDVSGVDGLVISAVTVSPPNAAPMSVGDYEEYGDASRYETEDHVHAHGTITFGSAHALATFDRAGFVSPEEKAVIDAAGGLQTAPTEASYIMEALTPAAPQASMLAVAPPLLSMNTTGSQISLGMPLRTRDVVVPLKSMMSRTPTAHTSWSNLIWPTSITAPDFDAASDVWDAFVPISGYLPASTTALTSIRVSIDIPYGHAAMPQVRTDLYLLSRVIAGGDTKLNRTFVGGTTLATYEGTQVVTLSPTGLNLSATIYAIGVHSEYGTNAIPGTRILQVCCTVSARE